MMKHTKVASPSTRDLREMKKSIFNNNHARKASVDVSRNSNYQLNSQQPTSNQQSVQNGIRVAGQIGNSRLSLPDVGRTVTHKPQRNIMIDDHDFDDPKMQDLVAKQAFMKVDERTL